MALLRFGVSLEKDLLNSLDRYAKKNAIPNRSRAIRHLIRQYVVEDRWKGNKVVAGAIVLVYDHDQRELQRISTQVQHEHHHLILSVQHVHLDHDRCLETIAVKGRARQLEDLAARLTGQKGITHGELVMTAI